MRTEVRQWNAHAILVLGAIIALVVSGWGCVASFMLDFWTFSDWALALVFVLPFPCYIVRFFSFRWGTVLLWAAFLAFWMVRIFFLGRTPTSVNPIDALGCAYIAPAVFTQAAALLFPTKKQIS